MNGRLAGSTDRITRACPASCVACWRRRRCPPSATLTPDLQPAAPHARLITCRPSVRRALGRPLPRHSGAVRDTAPLPLQDATGVDMVHSSRLQWARRGEGGA